MSLKREEKLATILLGLGQRLREFRLSKNMKQREFALICGVQPNYLSEIETGKRGLTDAVLYNLLAAFSDFDANYIIIGRKKELETTPTEGG